MFYVAFDNDYQENPAVVRQIARLLKLRLDDNKINGSPAPTKILLWTQTKKGIDDALLNGEKLNEITILDWFSTLGLESREEVRKVWEDGEFQKIVSGDI